MDVSFAVSMNLFLLLPTGLSILGNKKDTGDSTSLLKILGVNPTLDSILYSPYGCGLTLFCLYALFLCIREKKTRKLAIAVFVLLFFDIFYWILNATLYVRPKCLIPFLPLILYLAAQALEGLRQKKTTPQSATGFALCNSGYRTAYFFYIINRSGTWSQLILYCFLSVLPLAFFWRKKKSRYHSAAGG